MENLRNIRVLFQQGFAKQKKIDMRHTIILQDDRAFDSLKHGIQAGHDPPLAA